MNKIKELRTEKKFSQGELAEVLNVHQTAVSQWEKGRTMPDIETLQKMAEIFNVTTDYLLGETKQAEWHNDMYEDFWQANSEDKMYLLQKWGVPKDLTSYMNSNETENEINEYLDDLHKNPELRMLFSAAKGVSKESLTAVVEMLKHMKKDSGYDDDTF